MLKGMLIQEARELVATLTRTQLRDRFPVLLLAIAHGSEPLELGFRTEKAPVQNEVRSLGIEQIVPIIKAPKNPYAARISVGRTRNCDIVLRDPSVSKLHANFFEAKGRMEVADLASHNGTLRNGHRMRPHISEAVEIGDTLILGRVSTSVLDADSLYDLLVQSSRP